MAEVDNGNGSISKIKSVLSEVAKAGYEVSEQAQTVTQDDVVQEAPKTDSVVHGIGSSKDAVAGVSDDSVTESIRIMLSNGLEDYFVASANDKYVSDTSIYRLYVQSQFVDGEITGREYEQQMQDIGNNLYKNGDDAYAWISSFDRENNPWHYEPVATGRTYGSSATDEADVSDVNVDLGASGLDVDTSLTQEQLEMINELNGTGKSELSTEEQTALYARLVSDNYSANRDVTDLCDGDITKLPYDIANTTSGNLVINDGQGVMLDVSEMSIGRKTKMDGPIKPTSIGDTGLTAEEYLKQEYQKKVEEKKAAEKNGDTYDWDESDGVSIDVCGGTLTYNGSNDIMKQYHFESSYLGEFDYAPPSFQLAYKTDTTTVNGEKQEIAVPCLHSNKDAKLTNANTVTNAIAVMTTTPPDGIKVCDYMFDGCENLTSMPVLPDTMVSAHAMFNGCTAMRRACNSAKTGEYGEKWYETGWLGGDVGKGGEMDAMPNTLEDVSYMFCDCVNMEDSFEKMGKNVWDARGMYQGCEDVNDMIDMSNCKYLLTEMAEDMYTGGNTKLQKKVADYISENNGSLSEWTGDGVKNHLWDRIYNGLDVTDPKWTAWQKYVDARELIKAEDPTGGGAVTGLEALTAGLSSYGVQRTADGNAYADDSTWAVLREDYQGTDGGSNNAELLDKGLAFLGTFGLSATMLRVATKNKWIALVGGAAIATVPQLIGTANKISPFLKSVSGLVGEDSVVGKGLSKMADKLGASNSDDKVTDVMSVEELFDNRQTETKKYTEATLLTLTNTETNSKVGAGFYMKQINTMRENGRLLAQDGNLDVIAYTSEEEYATSCNSAVMCTACDGMMQHIDSLAQNGELTDSQKEEIGNAFIVMMQNIKSYSNGAEDEIKTGSDPEKIDRMTAGLGKVMRNTTEPVYSLICQADAKYGILTDEQRSILDTMKPNGTTSFSEYEASYDTTTYTGNIGTPSIDVYVSQLESGVQEAKAAEANASSKSERNELRMKHLEQNYGWMIDLANEHMVKYDMGLSEESEEADAEIEAE